MRDFYAVSYPIFNECSCWSLNPPPLCLFPLQDLTYDGIGTRPNPTEQRPDFGEGVEEGRRLHEETCGGGRRVHAPVQ